jgi:hypothetical protein
MLRSLRIATLEEYPLLIFILHSFFQALQLKDPSSNISKRGEYLFNHALFYPAALGITLV